MEAAEFDTACPYCGYLQEVHTSLGGPAVPKPGDFSICWDCTNLCQYGSNLQLIIPPKEEYDRFMNDKEAARLIHEVRDFKSKLEKRSKK